MPLTANEIKDAGQAQANGISRIRSSHTSRDPPDLLSPLVTPVGLPRKGERPRLF
jgi:hypothetical protein